MNECLDLFPNLSQHYEIHISHSKGNTHSWYFGSNANRSQVIELALSRVPHDIRDSIIEVIMQVKPSWSQKRAMLLKKGLLRSIVDELEVLSDTGEITCPLGVSQSIYRCRRGRRITGRPIRKGLAVPRNSDVVCPGRNEEGNSIRCPCWSHEAYFLPSLDDK